MECGVENSTKVSMIAHVRWTSLPAGNVGQPLLLPLIIITVKLQLITPCIGKWVAPGRGIWKSFACGVYVAVPIKHVAGGLCLSLLLPLALEECREWLSLALLLSPSGGRHGDGEQSWGHWGAQGEGAQPTPEPAGGLDGRGHAVRPRRACGGHRVPVRHPTPPPTPALATAAVLPS